MTNIGEAAILAPPGDGRDVDAAIKAFRNALTVFTLEAFPEQWAAMQDRLGSAYGDRDRGNRAANERNAIEAFEAALFG